MNGFSKKKLIHTKPGKLFTLCPGTAFWPALYSHSEGYVTAYHLQIKAGHSSQLDENEDEDEDSRLSLQSNQPMKKELKKRCPSQPPALPPRKYQFRIDFLLKKHF